MQYGIKQYIFVIRELTAREIKRKYSRSVLGVFWSILQPLMFMCVMSLVFSKVSHSTTSYPVYYLTGYTLWSLFSESTMNSMTAFEDNKKYFERTKLPREVFVLSRDYTALVNLGFSCVALVAVLVIFKIQLNWTIIFLPITVFFEMIFTIGISFFLATVYVFYKDTKFWWRNIIVWLVHTVAVYVPIEKYPEFLHAFTRANPMYIYPNIARRCILEKSFDINELKGMVLWSLFSFTLGFLTFKSKENEIVKKI